MRVAQSDLQKPVWQHKMTARGGGQGSRLMMVAFVFSMAHTLDTATKKLTDEGVPITRIGYQDDQYFKTSVKNMPRVARVVTQAMTSAGRKLNAAKCGVWVPALDQVPDHELPQKVADVVTKCPRCRSHLDALGGGSRRDDNLGHGRRCKP